MWHGSDGGSPCTARFSHHPTGFVSGDARLTLVLKYSSILDWTSSPNAATARHELSAPQIRSARTLFRGAVKKVIKDFSTSLLSHWCRKAASPVDGRLSSSLRTGWCHTLHQYAGYFYPTFVLVSRGVRGCLRPSLPAGRLISATKFAGPLNADRLTTFRRTGCRKVSDLGAKAVRKGSG